MTPPFLSIIIPAHNEASRLPTSLQSVFSFLQQQVYTSEVLVVENASTDGTLQVAEQFSYQYPTLRVLHEDLPGKGRAVRLGVLAAEGEYRFIADADFSMPVAEIARFLPPACPAEVVIASRQSPGAVRYGEPFYRHITGRFYNLLIRALVLPGLQDTQCGFKNFSARAARQIFPLVTLNGWAFDVEVLAIARRHGFSIVEIGIPWYYVGGSKIRVLRHSLGMFLDLLTIRRNLRQGLYDPPA